MLYFNFNVMSWIKALNKLDFIFKLPHPSRDRNRIVYTSAMHTNRTHVESGSREGKHDSNTVTRSQELHTREYARVVPLLLEASVLLC